MVTTRHVTAARDITWRATSREAVHGFGRPYARIAWGAIFAGAVVALAVQLVLTLIGGAIGLTMLDSATGQSPSGKTLGIGAATWLVISSLISFFVAGYVAGRLGGTFSGWLHGLATWATVTMLTILLLATAAGGLVGAASGLGAFAVNNSDKMWRAQLPLAVQQKIDQLTAQAGQTAVQAQPMTPEHREAQARDIEQRAAKDVGAGSGAASIGLILGAVAAAIGGRVGQRLPYGITEIEEEDRTDPAVKPAAGVNSEKLTLVSTTARRHAMKSDNPKLSGQPRTRKRKSQPREKSKAASKSMELKPTVLEGLSHTSPPASSAG